MRIAHRLVVAIVPVVLGAGCSSTPSPTSFLAFAPGPTPTVYAGTVTDSVGGSGAVKVSLVNVQDLVSGTWEMSFAGKADPTRYISGPLNGTAYTATVEECPSTELTSCAPNCRFVFTGSFSSSGLVGTFTPPASLSPSCPLHSGTMNAARQ